MNKKWLAVSFGLVVTVIIFFFSSCKKINESTDLGRDLIPTVDNITTFDTIIDVQAFNDTFGLANDSLRFVNSDEAFLGYINNDPIFGQTDARLFLELKPPSYKFYFLNRPDSLFLDSVVLILSHVETYGDSTIPQTVNVYELDQSDSFTIDSSYLVRQNDFTYSNLLGSKTFLPSSLEDSVFARGDTTANQLRIRLNDSFGSRLLHYDSTDVTGAYSSDSVFQTFFKGFALQAMNNGNAIMGFDLNGANTKLAIYYKYGTKLDTAVSYFNFNSLVSASANYVKRNYSGKAIESSFGRTTPAPFVYLQNTPGTFATLKISGLTNVSNRVVQRAELIAEQVYDPSNDNFTVPRLYLDAYDTINTKFRAIPYDLSYDPNSGTTDLHSFGSDPVDGMDGSGHVVKVWHFNITRYVQHVLTHTLTPYTTLRLYAPFVVSNLYGTPPDAGITIGFICNNAIARGRVRLAGNTGPLDPNPQKMRLRIIYSKL